jgi:hypothetical protein
LLTNSPEVVFSISRKERISPHFSMKISPELVMSFPFPGHVDIQQQHIGTFFPELIQYFLSGVGGIDSLHILCF